jgi:RNA polymerase sigma-70 factor (ECF subfamily)
MKSAHLDTELVAGFKNGNEACFLELVELYTQKVHNLAMRITRNEEDSEEIIQDVFVTVYKKIDKFEGKSAFSSWLYRITANAAFMKLRKRKQTPALSLEDFTPATQESWLGSTPESSDISYLSTRHELRSALESAIEKLPAEYKAIFVLRDVDGLSNQEVGEVLHLTVPAVKSRLHRARLMLRRTLSKFYQDYSDDSYISFGSEREHEEEMTAHA